MTADVTIRIQDADFDIGGEISALTKGRTDIGAVVSFSGICRGSEAGEPIAALTLEHYPGMAEAEIARHAEAAGNKAAAAADYQAVLALPGRSIAIRSRNASTSA